MSLHSKPYNTALLAQCESWILSGAEGPAPSGPDSLACCLRLPSGHRAILPSLRHVGRIPASVSLLLVWFTLPETLFWLLREWTPHSFRPLLKCYATVWGVPWPPRVPQPSPWPVFPSSMTHALIFLQSTHLLQRATFPGLCFSVPPHQATGSTG